MSIRFGIALAASLSLIGAAYAQGTLQSGTTTQTTTPLQSGTTTQTTTPLQGGTTSQATTPPAQGGSATGAAGAGGGVNVPITNPK